MMMYSHNIGEGARQRFTTKRHSLADLPAPPMLPLLFTSVGRQAETYVRGEVEMWGWVGGWVGWVGIEKGKREVARKGGTEGRRCSPGGDLFNYTPDLSLSAAGREMQDRHIYQICKVCGRDAARQRDALVCV
jgi:hypothetical protein